MSEIIKLGISPEELLKAADSIKGQFVNKKGIFDAAAFATQVGVSLNQKNGFITQIVQDRKTKELKTLKLDEGPKYSQWTREMAEEIPPEVEKLIKSMTEGDTLWPLFQEYVASGLKKAKENAIKATQPNWEIAQGHLKQIGGDKSGAGLFRNPHVRGNIYNEPSRSRNFERRLRDEKIPVDDKIIGNGRRHQKPELHFDPVEIELSGGQVANDWREVIAQFLTDGMTGTNVDELTQETVELARDEGMSLQQAAAIQDRKDQLSQQFSYSSSGSIKVKDFMTKTEDIMTKDDIFKRPDNFFGQKTEAQKLRDKELEVAGGQLERGYKVIEKSTRLVNETLPSAGEFAAENTVGQIPVVKAGQAGIDIGNGNYVSGALRVLGLKSEEITPYNSRQLSEGSPVIRTEIEAIGRDIAGKNY